MSNPPSSKRLVAIPASPIRKLVPYAVAAKQEGIKVYHLNIGDPDIETPQVMLDALKNWSKNPIGYSQSKGEPIFIDALKTYYHRLGYQFIGGDDIQVTSGGSEAISMAFFATCEGGDEVLVFEPLYTLYNSFAAINNVKLVPVRTSADAGFHLPPRIEIEKKITKKTKAILICNPSNPTGTVYTQQEMDTLFEIAKNHNLFLLSDEVYREFVYDDRRHISVLDYMKKLPEKIILLDSLSKRFSICGARIGTFISKNKAIMDGVLRIAQSRLSVGLIDQTIAARLTSVPRSYFKKVHREYQKRRDVLYEELKKIPGVSLKKPEGAFYAVVTLPIRDSEHFSKWLLTDFRFKNQTVMVAPAPGFYVTKGLGKQEVRMAYVINISELKKAIEILRRALIEYKD